jgi:hypothetical protein
MRPPLTGLDAAGPEHEVGKMAPNTGQQIGEPGERADGTAKTQAGLAARAIFSYAVMLVGGVRMSASADVSEISS